MIADISDQLIPRGTRSCRTRAGVSRMLSKDEGPATLTRSDHEIALESKRGPLKISEVEGKVEVSLPSGKKYVGGIEVDSSKIVFRADGGERQVTLARVSKGIEVNLDGFGAADHVKIFLDF